MNAARNYVSSTSRFAPRRQSAPQRAKPANAESKSCTVCTFRWEDDTTKERIDYFSCVKCDARQANFYIACRECVRARWPEPDPANYTFVIVLPMSWSVGCPRCEPKVAAKK